ncbi:hypothetical protein BCR44DRAFT_55896 [Catenaria anguillulae PL171]|uniref:Uncharacterized protein n=1 Tax=Catenaria anguillulae PL171 TaxID=765915 RepID=A0A1Y2H5Y0_9FUNG|nr:hypothetical protein BCR44DRAFT_55896 [Catenaria anguillulae PL171]
MKAVVVRSGSQVPRPCHLTQDVHISFQLLTSTSSVKSGDARGPATPLPPPHFSIERMKDDKALDLVIEAHLSSAENNATLARTGTVYEPFRRGTRPVDAPSHPARSTQSAIQSQEPASNPFKYPNMAAAILQAHHRHLVNGGAPMAHQFPIDADDECFEQAVRAAYSLLRQHAAASGCRLLVYGKSQSINWRTCAKLDHIFSAATKFKKDSGMPNIDKLHLFA